MRFQADVESLTVLVGKGKYCKFINGIYETEDKEEIAALRRAKGVREIKETETKSAGAKKISTKSNKPQKKKTKR